MIRAYGMTLDEYYEAAVEASAIDTQPLSEWDALGKRKFLSTLHLPRISEKTARSVFNKMWTGILREVKARTAGMTKVVGNTFSHNGEDWILRKPFIRMFILSAWNYDFLHGQRINAFRNLWNAIQANISAQTVLANAGGEISALVLLCLTAIAISRRNLLQ